MGAFQHRIPGKTFIIKIRELSKCYGSTHIPPSGAIGHPDGSTELLVAGAPNRHTSDTVVKVFD